MRPPEALRPRNPTWESSHFSGLTMSSAPLFLGTRQPFPTKIREMDTALIFLQFACYLGKVQGGPHKTKRISYPAKEVAPDIPQSGIAATHFFDWAKFWAKNWAKDWAKFWTIISGHFRASLAVQNDPPKFLPELLPIYRSMSCHGSCD